MMIVCWMVDVSSDPLPARSRFCKDLRISTTHGNEFVFRADHESEEALAL